VVGFIDFDTAHPGPRIWDLAYAVYRFVPLQAPTNPESVGDPLEQARRAIVFCQAYGVQPGAALLDAVADRLRALVELMRLRADAGYAAFEAHVAGGHLALYEEDIRYVEAQRETFLRAFGAPMSGSDPGPSRLTEDEGF
jgi:Ser/Thr protein kinase RdoA (MazF antagonist)